MFRKTLNNVTTSNVSSINSVNSRMYKRIKNIEQSISEVQEKINDISGSGINIDDIDISNINGTNINITGSETVNINGSDININGTEIVNINSFDININGSDSININGSDININGSEININGTVTYNIDLKGSKTLFSQIKYNANGSTNDSTIDFGAKEKTVFYYCTYGDFVSKHTSKQLYYYEEDNYFDVIDDTTLIINIDGKKSTQNSIIVNNDCIFNEDKLYISGTLTIDGTERVTIMTLKDYIKYQINNDCAEISYDYVYSGDSENKKKVTNTYYVSGEPDVSLNSLYIHGTDQIATIITS